MYWLFGGDCYYPRGGIDDFVDEFSCHVSAEIAAYAARYDWWHVVRAKDRKFMAAGYCNSMPCWSEEKGAEIVQVVKRKCIIAGVDFFRECASSLLNCGELGDVTIRVDCADPYLIYSKRLERLVDVNEGDRSIGSFARTFGALDAIRSREIQVSKVKDGEFYAPCSREWQAFVYKREMAVAKAMLERVGYMA